MHYGNIEKDAESIRAGFVRICGAESDPGGGYQIHRVSGDMDFCGTGGRFVSCVAPDGRNGRRHNRKIVGAAAAAILVLIILLLVGGVFAGSFGMDSFSAFYIIPVVFGSLGGAFGVNLSK